MKAGSQARGRRSVLKLPHRHLSTPEAPGAAVFAAAKVRMPRLFTRLETVSARSSLPRRGGAVPQAARHGREPGADLAVVCRPLFCTKEGDAETCQQNS